MFTFLFKTVRLQMEIFRHSINLYLLKLDFIFPGRRQGLLKSDNKTAKTNPVPDRSGKSGGAGSSSKNIFRIGLHAPELEISNVHSEPAMNRKSVNVHFNADQGNLKIHSFLHILVY